MKYFIYIFRTSAILLLFNFCTIAIGDEESIATEGDNQNDHSEAVVSRIEKEEVLEMLALQIDGNKRAVATWQAEYSFTDCILFPGVIPRVGDGHAVSIAEAEIEDLQRLGLGVRPGNSGYWEITRGNVKVSADSEARSMHTTYIPARPLTFVSAAEGEVYQWTSNGDAAHWLLTPEHVVFFEPDINRGQIRDFPVVDSVPDQGGRIAFRRPLEEANAYTRVFNPNSFYSNGKQQFDDICRSYAKSLRGEDSPGSLQHVDQNVDISRITVDGDLQFVMTSQYPKSQMRVSTVYDSSVGFNVIKYTKMVGDVLVEQREMHFTDIGEGVFVPRRFELVKYRLVPGDGDTIELYRLAELNHYEVNGVIDKSIFGVGSLDIQYGERMLDEIEDKMLVCVAPGEFLPAQSFILDRSRLPANHPMSTVSKMTVSNSESSGTSRHVGLILLVVNAIVVLGVIVIFCWRRMSGI